jgi:hypothetical protein
VTRDGFWVEIFVGFGYTYNNLQLELAFWRWLFMSIGKSKVMSMVSLLAASLVWVGLLSDFGAGKEKAKAATNKDKLIVTARSP